MTNVLSFPAPSGLPLLPAASHAAPYPVESLAALRAAVEAAQRRTQAPVAIAAQTALSLASLAVQGFANVETLGGYRPVSLYALTIAASGERKSTVDSCLSGDLSSHGRTITEPTTDALFRVLRGTPSVGLLSDEAGSFLGGYALSRSNAQRTFGTFNSLWDGKQITKDLAKETIRLRARRLCLHLQAQPAVMQKLLADPLAESIGFLPRCLIVEPASNIGRRAVSAYVPEPNLDAFQMRLDTLMSAPLPIPDPDLGDLAPRQLSLSDDARDLLIMAANVIEKEQAPGGRYETIRAFASKTAEQACRIAGVLTLWADEMAVKVKKSAIVQGLKLAIYYADEALRLMGCASVGDELRLADKLLTWLRARGSEQFITSLVIQSAPDRAMRSKATALRLLSILEEHHHVRRLPDGTVIDGAPRKSGWMMC